jgi:hypothetical protein
MSKLSYVKSNARGGGATAAALGAPATRRWRRRLLSTVQHAGSQGEHAARTVGTVVNQGSEGLDVPCENLTVDRFDSRTTGGGAPKERLPAEIENNWQQARAGKGAVTAAVARPRYMGAVPFSRFCEKGTAPFAARTTWVQSPLPKSRKRGQSPTYSGLTA